MQRTYLDFEKPLEALEKKLEELRRYSNGQGPPPEATQIEQKLKSLRKEIFSSLTPWQKTQLARHPERPYTLDYIQLITEDFLELHGDRRFGDDSAIVGGLGTINGQTFVIVGHQKGRTLKERMKRNFGQPHPEGY
ncbi:MAG: acetyl-CoA carboxylase carboxyl transferase subunit alpha, partial [Nitrospirae bacterium]